MFLPILCFRTPPFSSLLLQRAQFQRQNFPRYLSRKRERDIIFREKSVAPRKKKIWNTNCCLSSRFRYSRATVSNFIFRAITDHSRVSFLHSNIFPRRTRLYWKLPEAVATVLPESRERDRFGGNLEDSWNVGACSNIGKLKNLCKNNHENDYGCRMRIIFLSL